jgi:hypothetical protein
MRIKSDPIDTAPQQLNITVKDPGLDFSRAKKIATEEARKKAANAMLLSWNDLKRGVCYPDIECGSRRRPAWVVYAQSRGGNLTVEINGGEYTFIYLML